MSWESECDASSTWATTTRQLGRIGSRDNSNRRPTDDAGRSLSATGNASCNTCWSSLSIHDAEVEPSHSLLSMPSSNAPKARTRRTEFRGGISNKCTANLFRACDVSACIREIRDQAHATHPRWSLRQPHLVDHDVRALKKRSALTQRRDSDLVAAGVLEVRCPRAEMRYRNSCRTCQKTLQQSSTRNRLPHDPSSR